MSSRCWTRGQETSSRRSPASSRDRNDSTVADWSWTTTSAGRTSRSRRRTACPLSVTDRRVGERDYVDGHLVGLARSTGRRTVQIRSAPVRVEDESGPRCGRRHTGTEAPDLTVIGPEEFQGRVERTATGTEADGETGTGVVATHWSWCGPGSLTRSPPTDQESSRDRVPQTTRP